MLRTLPGLRWSCELCRVVPCSFSSSSKGASSDGPPDQPLKSEVRTKQQVGSAKGKKIASKEEVNSKLSGLLASLTVEQRHGGTEKKELKLAGFELRRLQVQEPATPQQQALKVKFQTVGSSMAKAVQSVAKEVGGGENTEDELLDSLKRVSTPDAQPISSESTDKLRSALSGLSVERRRSRHTSRRALNISPGVSLYDAEPLNIFPAVDDSALSPSSPLLPTWETQQARELQLSTTTSPDSHFQELIRWTEQGKIWHFPINNELGIELEEESKTGFQDHIFLERHLLPWCPKKGPIAHFMELVCVGLSKNPYVSAQRKKDTIFWYRDYFESKKKLLKEIGATDEVSPEKQKEA